MNTLIAFIIFFMGFGFGIFYEDKESVKKVSKKVKSILRKKHSISGNYLTNEEAEKHILVNEKKDPIRDKN